MSRSNATIPAAVIEGSELIHLGGGESLACPGIERIPIAESERGYGVGSPSLALPPARVHRLRGVRVLPGERVVVDRSGTVVAECLGGDSVRDLDREALRRGRSAKAADIDQLTGTVALYRSPRRAHYHTLVDHLPRAALLAQPALGRIGEISLVYDGSLSPFEELLLPRLLPRRVQLVAVEADCVIEADSVLLPGYVTRPGAGAIPSWYRRWIDRQTTLIAQQGDDSPLPRRFFIERSTTRRVRNRAGLDEVLERHRIEAVDLSAMSAAEVVRLFRDATLVIGATGSGLANTLFSRSAHVIELLAGQQLLPHIYYLATSKGLAYDYVAALPDGHGASPRERLEDDLTVDLGALDRLLTA